MYFCSLCLCVTEGTELSLVHTTKISGWAVKDPWTLAQDNKINKDSLQGESETAQFLSP